MRGYAAPQVLLTVGAQSMDINGTRPHYVSSLRWWMLFDLCLPAVFVAMFWPVRVYLLDQSLAFERAFYTVDLLPIASILLIGVAREIELERDLGRISRKLGGLRDAGIFLAMVIMLIYSVIRYFSLEYSFPDQGSVEAVAVRAAPYLSGGVLLIAGTFGFYAKSSIIRYLR